MRVLEDPFRVPVQRSYKIVRGKQGVTAALAGLLAQAFDTTPGFGMNLETSHEMVVKRPAKAVPPL